MGQEQLPPAARRLIRVTIALAIGAVAMRVPDLARWHRTDALLLIALATVAVLTEQFQISIPHGSETQNFSLTDALWVPGLILARPSVLTMSVFLGILVGEALRRWAPYKIAFNVSQFVLGITVAELVYAVTAPRESFGVGVWIAAVLAMTAFFITNETMISLVIALVERQPFRTTLILPACLNILMWGVNATIGLLATLIWTIEPRALPLLIGPIVMSYLVYRAWMASRRRQEEAGERERMSALYAAAQALIGPLDGSLDLRTFLVRLGRVVDAPAAQIVVVEDGQVTVHDPKTGSTPSGPWQDQAGRPLDSFLLEKPGLHRHLVFVGDHRDGGAVLAVHRARALSEAEISMLEALASQVAVKLQNRRLFLETREQHAQLADIIAHTSDGIAMVSPDGRFRSWNPAMESITGFPEEVVIGRTWTQVFGAGQEDGGLVIESRVGPGERRDAAIVTPAGVRRWIRYTSSAIPDRIDGVAGYVLVARDVTAELEAERLKSDFVAMVSHELRTPLTPLKGYLSLLASDGVVNSSEQRHEYFDVMLRHADRLERLIDDLLDVSVIGAGALATEAEPIDLVGVVGDEIHEHELAQPTRRIGYTHPSRVGVQAMGDTLRVRQVVANLLSNAFKYTSEDSPIEVRVGVSKGYAIVSVTDHGTGIDRSEQARVFERFHRVENASTQRTSGTGLGLYIAHQLVQAMHGRIWVESEPGNGATFCFSLPLVTASPPERGPEDPAEGRIRITT